MKKLHGKMLMAAIILSCGLVMQLDSPAPHSKAKRTTVAEAWNWHLLGTAEALTHPARPAGTSASHDEPASRQFRRLQNQSSFSKLITNQACSAQKSSRPSNPT